MENCTEDQPACEKLSVIQPYACSDMENDHETEDDHDVPNIVDRHNRFIFYYMNIAEKVRLSVGHQFSDMVKFCTFKGKDCLDERYVVLALLIMVRMIVLGRMFSISSSSMYGNCYTFNSQTEGQQGRTSLLAGQNLGLSLVIDIGQPVYMKRGLTTTAGIRATIHDPSVRFVDIGLPPSALRYSC